MKYVYCLQTRFRVIDRKTGMELNTEIKYETDACMTFHHANAYEDNGKIKDFSY